MAIVVTGVIAALSVTGFNSTVRYISEHIPAPATVIAQLRLTF